jgi:hypothetical protein
VYITKSKPREIQCKVLIEENKMWRLISGHLTVKRRGKDAISNN